MTRSRKTLYLSTTPLQIGYKQKNRTFCIARTPEMEIHAGDFICLLGPNGAGKSTLIRTLSGVQTPLQGTIKLNKPYDYLNPRERALRISLVLTEMPSLGMLDAYSLVALGRHPYSGRFGTLGKEDKERIDWAFQTMDALELRNCQVSCLSDGERQKLMIARALAQDTPLMLLDEPTAFLDLPRQIELLATLRKLAHEEQMGILLSIHNLDLALRFADRIWLLKNDGTIAKGYPEELVIGGVISHTFSSRNIKWDTESGIFCVQENPILKASVEGDGAPAFWTRHALKRLGFTIVENTENPVLEVVVSQTDQTPQWRIACDGCNHHYSSIENMIDWILNHKLGGHR